MVGVVAIDIFGVFRIYRLFDVGSITGRALYLRPVPFADVFAADLGSGRTAVIKPRVAWPMAGLDAEHHFAADAGFPDPLGSRRIQVHVLLLSRCLLLVILGRSARLCRRRTTAQLSRRT